MDTRFVAFLRFCNSLFGSRRLLALFLITAPLLVLFLAFVAVFELPLGHGIGTIESPLVNPVLEIPVRCALIMLVMTMLYVPIAWLFQFSRLSGLVIFSKDAAGGELTAEARAEFLGWLTAISVPYLVLGFSMTIEFHAVLEDPSKGVGAIAAIMVLYALSVLSSFLYIEVRDLRSGFSREMKETSSWMRYSSELGDYQTPIGTPAKNVTILLDKWIELLVRGRGDSGERSQIRQNLLGTLLASYIKEESENIGGNLTSDRQPIWVSELTKAANRRGAAGCVAYLATNVGFYAQYLSTAVKGLTHALPKERSVVLATITYVLPPFWWNWPYASEHHGIYEPIEKFRETLIGLAKGDDNNGKSLKVFRRMLVRSGSNESGGGVARLSDRTLSDVFASTFCTKDDWLSMKRWRILKHSDGYPLTSRIRSTVNTEQLAGPIRWTEGNRREANDESQVYWMGDGAEGTDVLSEPLLSYYHRLMHPAGGSSEVCEIDFNVFRSSFALDPEIGGGGGLNGCPEITFIGTCGEGCENVWESDANFGLAFLSNMTKGHDSMFLAVVVDEWLVETLWRSVCATLNSRVIDSAEISDLA